jgi:nucleoside phosphorylase
MQAPKVHATSLNILVALNCEARPLIDLYRLKKRSAKGLAWYRRSADQSQLFNINLVISGIGALNMVSACSWLAAKTEQENCAWLNTGTAGHGTLPVGELVRVVHSIEQSSDKSHYPPLVSKFKGTAISLLTNNTPVADYPENQAVDMEAHAFFTTAKRFASSELVQSIKVISDNKDNDLELLNAKKITQLIAAQANSIDQFARSLVELAPSPIVQFEMDEELKHLHCTTSQMLQFQSLMAKLDTMPLERNQIRAQTKGVTSMRDLLARLTALQIETAPHL